MCATHFILLLLAVQFTLQNTDHIEVRGRINLGEKAKHYGVPYQVVLRTQINERKRLFCGGSLITTKFVLTAAHCLVDVQSVLVQLGMHACAKKYHITVETTKFNYHKKYDRENVINDIGYVELPNPVKLNKYIGIVKLLTNSGETINLVGKYGKTSGWGATSQQSAGQSDVLKELRVRVLSNELCPLYQKTLDQTKICVIGELNGTVCVGDSGSPLVLEDTNRQIGITSYSSEEISDHLACAVGYPHVYTNVYVFLDWIYKNTDYKKT